jgi:glucosylceramidase
MHSQVLRVVACMLAVGGVVPKSLAVNVWITSGDRTSLLSQKVDALFGSGVGQGGIQVDINPAQTYQTIDGFGAAMTDSSAWVMNNLLNASQRQQLMQTLFSPQSGIGISYLRVPMGASDFTASGQYSYDDMPPGQTDPNLMHFSIAHDQAYIIPALLTARSLNPQLHLMASPWSAPGWMKTSGSMIGGSLAPQWSAAYATYFEKFIQAYGGAGLPIDTVSLQNEPLYVPADYPGMGMSAAQQTDLIRNYFGPGFAANGISTKILAYDHNWDNASYPEQVLSDPVANQYVAGSAFHGYGGSVTAQTSVHSDYPQKGIYFTEFSGGTWANNFADNLIYFAENEFIGATQNYAKNVMLWNLALDQNGGPHQGGCSGCRGVVTVNSSTGAITYNEEFYSIAQASKFVMPGAVRIYSSTQPGVLDTVAFQNPDNTQVLLSANATGQSQTVRVVLNGQHFNYVVPAKSLATFVWGANQADFNNGSFEDGGYQNGGGSLDAWQSFGNTAGNVSVSSSQAAGGTHSLRLSGSGAAGSTAGAFQGLSVQSGDIIHAELSDLVRSAESFVGSTNSVQMKVEFYSVFGAAEFSSAFLGESVTTIADASTPLNTWMLHELNLVAPNNAVEARLSLLFKDQSGGAGTAYLDAAKFEVVQRIPGDYNGNGVVDAADYVVWRKGFANTFTQSDYDVWRAHFGETLDSGSAAIGILAVPEPVASVLLTFSAWAFHILYSCTRRRSCSCQR